MQKPTLIDAFHGDTIDIRIAVYGDNGQPFLLAENGLNFARMRIEGQPTLFSGTIDANIVAFKLTPSQPLPFGDHNFYAQVSGAMWPSDKYTVAHGKITIHKLPAV